MVSLWVANQPDISHTYKVIYNVMWISSPSSVRDNDVMMMEASDLSKVIHTTLGGLGKGFCFGWPPIPGGNLKWQPTRYVEGDCAWQTGDTSRHVWSWHGDSIVAACRLLWPSGKIRHLWSRVLTNDSTPSHVGLKLCSHLASFIRYFICFSSDLWLHFLW